MRRAEHPLAATEVGVGIVAAASARFIDDEGLVEGVMDVSYTARTVGIIYKCPIVSVVRVHGGSHGLNQLVVKVAASSERRQRKNDNHAENYDDGNGCSYHCRLSSSKKKVG